MLAVTAAISSFAGFMYGESSVSATEKRLENTIEECHYLLEAGLPADFGKCIAGGRYRDSN
jgi:hypothetical protein